MLFRVEIMNKDGTSRKNKIDQDFRTRSVRLKNRRTKETGKQLSYTKIADDSNLDCAVVKRIMKGERGATLSEAYAIAIALNTTVDHLSNMREHSPVEKGYHNLIEIFNNRRNQIVAEIEILKSKIELIDQQLAIHKDVSQTNPPVT